MENIIITTEKGNRLYTFQEVQGFLKVSESSLRRYIRQELLTPTETGIPLLLFTMSAIKQAALITKKADILLQQINV